MFSDAILWEMVQTAKFNTVHMLTSEQPADYHDQDLYIRMVAQACNQGEIAFGQRTSAHGLIIQIQGRAAVQIGNKDFLLQDSQLLRYQPGQQIRWTALSKDYQAMKITFKGKRAGVLLDKIDLVTEILHSASTAAVQLIQQIPRLIQRQEIGTFTPIKLAWDLIHAFDKTKDLGNDTNLVTDFQLLLDEGYHTHSVDQLAQIMKINRSTLYRQFKKHQQLSPKVYLDRYRFEMAVSLIQETQHSIEQISAQCGIQDVSWFTRRFRERHGITPAAWRKSRG